MEQVTPETLNKARDEIVKALDPICEKHGLTVAHLAMLLANEAAFLLNHILGIKKEPQKQ